MTAAVVTLGEAMLRLSVPPGVRLDRTAALDVHVAGSEVNVAAALAGLGIEARWIGALPENPLGRRVAAGLADAGVDLRGVTWTPDSRLGLFFVEFGAEPRPTEVWYDRRDSAFAALSAFDPALLEGARYAVVSGITPGLGPRSRALAEAFVAEARARGAGICVDVNFRGRLWSPDAAREALRPLLQASEVVVCSERDARLALECEGEDAALLARLREDWAPDAAVVVLTRGRHGALAADRGGAVHAQPGFRTEVVDRFGAGDAFVAGLLWGLIEQDLATALASGAALAALHCTVAGDLSHFSVDALARVMQGGGSELLR